MERCHTVVAVLGLCGLFTACATVNEASTTGNGNEVQPEAALGDWSEQVWEMESTRGRHLV
ncbi:hypothetical protein RvY_14831 [Ramazzottius varieornatus]|uniref:Uncharacterized protein n=1 Tax=Ramazzottius varieornatus TaxID=947166 RepID=A0A1D1VZV9_RAMVA|nr:hypothetical protein RvY_14831 [Ramazzottius varieornatus]